MMIKIEIVEQAKITNFINRFMGESNTDGELILLIVRDCDFRPEQRNPRVKRASANESEF